MKYIIPFVLSLCGLSSFAATKPQCAIIEYVNGEHTGVSDFWIDPANESSFQTRFHFIKFRPYPSSDSTLTVDYTVYRQDTGELVFASAGDFTFSRETRFGKFESGFYRPGSASSPRLHVRLHVTCMR